MSDVHKWDFAGAKVLGTSKVTINTATTTSYDFGTPDDINLATNANYKHGDRVMVVFSGSTGGTTDSLTFHALDAPDSSGSIGTAAAMTTSAVEGALASGTGDGFCVVGLKLAPGRPWLRMRVQSSGTTDTFVTHCTVLAVPSNV